MASELGGDADAPSLIDLHALTAAAPERWTRIHHALLARNPVLAGRPREAPKVLVGALVPHASAPGTVA